MGGQAGDRVVSVRLTRKLALTMNGVDVSRLKVGDTIELPESRARMLIESGWAEEVRDLRSRGATLVRRSP
jgi:hypothetical protein